MANFIHPDQKTLVVETNNLRFGVSEQVTTTLKLDESIVTSTPTVTATKDGSAPFAVIVNNGSTSSPSIVLTLSGLVTDYILGKTYTITISANGETDILNVIFLFSQFYNQPSWTNTEPEENIGGFYTINQIPQGVSILSTTVNTRLRSILEYASLLHFKVLDLANRYKLKKNLPDIINTAIFAGTIPAGYTGTITYTPLTNQIANIILRSTDDNAYTKIAFNYTTKQKTITFNGTPTTTTNSNYEALDTINVTRVTNSGGLIKQYSISNIQITRTNTTFTSVVDSNYSVTMPLVTGWTVTE